MRLERGCNLTAAVVSRRVVVGSSGLAVLGLLARSAFGQEGTKEPQRKRAESVPRDAGRDRMEELRAFSERMRNASREERAKIMEERRVQEHQRAIEDFKDRLGIPDKDWPAIKARIEKVYNLVHPLPQLRVGDERVKTEVQQRSRTCAS
ncbi:MAG: hypothetical protein JW955_16625 [Sedimentisphaerales bacterium]|nr:hypothetical protein [Sedimentisphaerales bacterium]